MAEHIVSVVWDEERARIEISYDDREPDRIMANEIVAVSLANDAGLVVAPSPQGVVRWIRKSRATF